jgi:hypothetical protein
MLKTEWKENFVYKPKELLQLFQSLPSAKMRMRTKIIVQVRVTRNHLIFFPSEFFKKFCRITQEFHCNLLWSCSLSNYRPRILEKFRLDDVCLTKKVLKIPETLCFCRITCARIPLQSTFFESGCLLADELSSENSSGIPF